MRKEAEEWSVKLRMWGRGPQWALEEEYNARRYDGGVVLTRWPFLSGVREYRPVEIHSG